MSDQEALDRGWGPFDVTRELGRGGFHWSIGVVGDILLIPLQTPDPVMNALLIGVGAFIMGLDRLRRFVSVELKGSNWLTKRLKIINSEVVDRFLVRASEKRAPATVIDSWIGLVLAWSICPRWITIMCALLFSHVDPLAKLGQFTSIYHFKHGFAVGKTLGGVLWGTGGGLFALCALIIQQQYWPFLPEGLTTWHCYLVYFTGVLAAPWIELYSGKLDNMTIPLGSGLIMLGFHFLLNSFGI